MSKKSRNKKFGEKPSDKQAKIRDEIRKKGRKFLDEVIPALAASYHVSYEEALNRILSVAIRETVTEEHPIEDFDWQMLVDEVFMYGVLYEGLEKFIENWQGEVMPAVPDMNYVHRYDFRTMANDPDNLALKIGMRGLLEISSLSIGELLVLDASSRFLSKKEFDRFVSNVLKKKLPERIPDNITAQDYEKLAALAKLNTPEKYWELIDEWVLYDRQKLIRWYGILYIKKIQHVIP